MTPTAFRERNTSPVPHRILAATTAGAFVLAACCACTTDAPHRAATETHAATSSAPAAWHSTGAQLAALMPSPGQLAGGLKITSCFNTGTGWSAPARPAALNDSRCSLALQISAGMLTAATRAAWATEQIDNNGETLEIVLAATAPGVAHEQLAQDRAFATRCARIPAQPDDTSGETGGLTVDTFANLGDEAIRIRVTGLALQPEVVLVRVGDQIAAVSDPDLPANEAATASIAHYLAERLTDRLG
jgi:hypothetical protein